MPGPAPSIGALLLLALVLSAPSARAQLVVVDQTRSVEVSIETRDDTFSSCIPFIDPSCTPDTTVVDTFGDATSAPDAGPFAATASVPAFPDTAAQQDSQITAAGITASGSHEAVATASSSGGFPVTLHGETHETGTRLEVEFSVAEATAWSLAGSVTTSALLASSSARIALIGPGGTLGEVEVLSDPGCTDPSCATVGPQPLALGGQLAPGTYTLEAEAIGTGGGLQTPSGAFDGTHAGSFEVELALGSDVPALPGWGAPLLGVVLAGLGGLAGAARRRRVQIPVNAS